MRNFSVLLSLPYPEASGAAVAARVMADGGMVVRPYTIEAFRKRPPMKGATRLVGSSSIVDSARAAMRRIPRCEGIASHLMYASQAAFDHDVRRSGSIDDAAIVIGYPGAIGATWSAAHPSAVKILLMVNGTPRAQNQAVSSVAEGTASLELVPHRVAFRVQQDVLAADLVFCPSDLATKQVMEYGVPADRICTLPYGIDFSRSGRPSWRSRATVLFVGQISYRKGVDLLVQAASRNPGIDFVFLGPKVSASLVQDLPENCTYLGERGWASVEGEMLKAQALVLPSREDSFGLVVTEALSRGLPCIVSPSAGSAEVIRKCGGGLVLEELTVTGILDALDKLLPTQSCWERHRPARHILRQYLLTWEEYAAELLAACRSRLRDALEACPDRCDR